MRTIQSARAVRFFCLRCPDATAPPRRARGGFLWLAVPVREGARAQDRLGRRAVQLAPAADEALRLLEDLLAPSARLRSTLRPWHLPTPPLALQARLGRGFTGRG